MNDRMITGGTQRLVSQKIPVSHSVTSLSIRVSVTVQIILGGLTGLIMVLTGSAEVGWW